MRYPDYPAFGGEYFDDNTGDEDVNRQWWEKPAVTMSLNKCQMGVLLVPQKISEFKRPEIDLA